MSGSNSNKGIRITATGTHIFFKTNGPVIVLCSNFFSNNILAFCVSVSRICKTRYGLITQHGLETAAALELGS